MSTVVLIIVVRPIVSWLAILNSTIDLSFLGKLGEYVISTSDLIAEKTLLLARADSIDKLLINIFIIAILPAIGEELFFRAIIQRLLYKVSGRFHLSIWVTAIVFGVMHFNVRGVLPIIFLGLILGYIYFYTENIWLAILAHFINNASLLLIFFKFPVETESVVSDNISIPSLLFSVLMSFSLLFFLYTVWEKRKSANSLKQ
ncbi:MAG: CPBP family intramembrane glutamic endopeptidase [Bacteroidota bacterium]